MTSAETTTAKPARTTARSAAAARRKAREQEILAATRRLFDAGGMRDAQIEDIARAVGVNRAIIYRHFTGKEELFALTLVGYLDELAERMNQATAATKDAPKRLSALVGAFVDFGIAYPAFVDCAQTLMRRTGPELLEEISEGAMLRLGRSMTSCLKQISDVLDDGEGLRVRPVQVLEHQHHARRGQRPREPQQALAEEHHRRRAVRRGRAELRGEPRQRRQVRRQRPVVRHRARAHGL